MKNFMKHCFIFGLTCIAVLEGLLLFEKIKRKRKE